MNDPNSPQYRAVSRWVRELASDDASLSAAEQTVLAEVLLGLRRVRFGAIQLQIQDARVVQLEITEKRRL